MLTLDEIRNIQFTKGIGGYKTAEVDDFVDECIATVEALIGEKDETTKKLNVLADKLMEYRQEEDNIRTALLSAQKMGDAVVREANLKAEQIVKEANDKAAQIERIARAEIADEQATLEKMKAEVADFKAQILSIYRQHLELISNLPDVSPAETAAPAAEQEPAAVVEEEIVDLNNEPIAAPEIEDISSGMAEDDTKVVLEEPDLSMLTMTEKKQSEPARKSRFDDLRFGDEYHIEDDDDDDDDEEEDRKSRKRFKRKK